MHSRYFCYWLQGLFELVNPETLTSDQIQIIRNHLDMVFYHEIDPSFGGDEVQSALNMLHSGSQMEEPLSGSERLSHGENQSSLRTPPNGPGMKC